MNSGSPPDLRQIFLSGFAPKRLGECDGIRDQRTTLDFA